MRIFTNKEGRFNHRENEGGSKKMALKEPGVGRRSRCVLCEGVVEAGSCPQWHGQM